jgi:hypothetical protein
VLEADFWQTEFSTGSSKSLPRTLSKIVFGLLVARTGKAAGDESHRL